MYYRKLQEHIIKQYNFFMDWAKLGYLFSSNNHHVQDYGKMNVMVLGDMDKRLWKLYGQRMEGWKRRAATSWKFIEDSIVGRQPLKKCGLIRMSGYLPKWQRHVLGSLKMCANPSPTTMTLIFKWRWMTIRLLITKISKFSIGKYHSLANMHSSLKITIHFFLVNSFGITRFLLT